MKNSINKALIGYGIIFSIGISLAYMVQQKSDADYRLAVERYKKESQIETEIAAKNISNSLAQIYQGIRTISFLPSVRTIDRYGKNLDANAHESITQIYRNMASNVAVSEIYIVPADLEPEQIDPNTGSLQEPILMFDGSEPKAEAQEEKKELITSIAQAEKVSEVEIYEYKLLKEHLDYFKKTTPDQTKIDNLNLPVVSGKEVLTCDNSEFEKTKNDSDRAGIIFSVPFFGNDGKLKGLVSAIIRSNVIREMLPATDFALVNQDSGYVALSMKEGQQNASSSAIRRAEPDPELLYSNVVAVETKDPRSKWMLWAGYPNDKFLSSNNFKVVQNFKVVGFGLAGLLVIVGTIIWAILLHSSNTVQKKIAELEKDVQKRIAENEEMAREQELQKIESEQQKKAFLLQLADDFEQRSQSSIQTVASAAVQLKQSAQSLSGTISNTSNIFANVSTTLGNTVSEVNKTKAVSTALLKANEKIGEVIGIIKSIASQIDLLAINATIESAHAGDVGKGFAVVAGEVKQLANQTTKATEGIRLQIDDIKRISNQVVSIFESIAEKVPEVDGYAIQVSSSTKVEQSTAEEVLRAAKTLSEQADGLTREIKSFLGEIRHP